MSSKIKLPIVFFKITFCQINLFLQFSIFSIYKYIYIYLYIYKWSFKDSFLTALVFLQGFSLGGIFCIFKVQHCHVSINTERIGCVGVKLFVYFSFILFNGFPSHGRIQFGHPNSSVPKNWYTTVNLLHIKFSASVKKASAFGIFSFTLLQQYKTVFKNFF